MIKKINIKERFRNGKHCSNKFNLNCIQMINILYEIFVLEYFFIPTQKWEILSKVKTFQKKILSFDPFSRFFCAYLS